MAHNNLPKNHASLVVHGEDRSGIVAAVASVLAKHGANIVSLDQHSEDPEGGAFFQRTVMHVPDLTAAMPALTAHLEAVVGDELGLEWRLRDLSTPLRVAILASKSDHCLLDLLWRQRRGELPISVPMVISNHTDVAEDVRFFGIPFFHIPTPAGGDRTEAEAEIVKLLADNTDLVVLARYMQILSGSFLKEVGVPVINIHHSFLPAFIGAGPYKRAKERGVKLIGSTAHYVTEDLDEGPIIEQDVVRVSHEESLAELVRRGADVERQVLARAVLWHCEDRVIRNGNRTIVF
ncbi:formyltetrahydrofolate deformylase [Streptomyces violaceusniger]|uniref:Formyltetrahydrofolate deformylase n=1 Tax=Streptomyces violaceusniger TaxID=68280 RepID=A0A4D4LPQ4_STRVO|nr:formyltetrahydrofolate deformylase [Streptomyces violaceusniger]